MKGSSRETAIGVLVSQLGKKVRWIPLVNHFFYSFNQCNLVFFLPLTLEMARHSN